MLENAQKILDSVAAGKVSIEELPNQSVLLASEMLERANERQTRGEKSQQKELAGMMEDPTAQVFTTCLTDQAFRTNRPARTADQINYLIDRFGVPKFLDWWKQIPLNLFRWTSQILYPVLVPAATWMIRRQMSQVILPGERERLGSHMEKRRTQAVRVNLNHLGEAILGEDEALHRLQVYLDDLSNPCVEYISVKISTICSQLNLLAWEETLAVLKSRLRQLYRAANTHFYEGADGVQRSKFVNLDMEEYRDLHLTVDLFTQVLDEEEFQATKAGIVLQAYLPDSHPIQRKLTRWARERVSRGGAPIKIRIVKGANLAMERVESSIHGWPQAPYDGKEGVDANYKKMVEYGCRPDNAAAVHLGIASHNLFDIAYAMLLRAFHGVEKQVCFEMLEGMADHMRKVVQELSGDMLLYCPAAKQEEFQNAVAYLIRRLDENTAEENFLRHQFSLNPQSGAWKQQASRFLRAASEAATVETGPRRRQDRNQEPEELPPTHLFDNDPDTDWALPQNRRWAEEIIEDFKGRNFGSIPLVIGGEQQLKSEQLGVGEDPSSPGRAIYTYATADVEDVKRALACAKQSFETWKSVPFNQRKEMALRVAQGLRRSRRELIGLMIADGGKTIPEADVEVCEAIDFCEYYWRSVEEHLQFQGIEWEARGTVVVTPPWNFPCAIPFGGIFAALMAGNCVIFKPARQAALIGYKVAQILWEAGFSSEVLQFLITGGSEAGNALISDSSVAAVILTGATETAQHFLKTQPRMDLLAETGGKNSIIVTSLSDRDLAISSIVQSAFGHSGQKCSACSLLILEKEIYDDPQFRRLLVDAAKSLKVGAAWELSTEVNPLIREPDPVLYQGLTELDEGEEWALEPTVDLENSRLYSPGIKWGVTTDSFTYRNELFGPVLSVMRAEDLSHAIELANGVKYGLTSGLHSLDLREHSIWKERIEAGNLYINRGTTGAIVQRQPFGGIKQSSFGRGSKAGGPNYVSQLMNPKCMQLPQRVLPLSSDLEQMGEQLPVTERELWKASCGSYLYWLKHYFTQEHDPSKILGEDNVFRYLPHRSILIRVQQGDLAIDWMRVVAAARMCGVRFEVSSEQEIEGIKATVESDGEFIARIDQFDRIRLISEPSELVRDAMAESPARLYVGTPLSHGRFELLYYLKEQAISVHYHRYGNLEDRADEPRKPLRQPQRSGVKEPVV